jgi:hypothetical protein
MNWMKHERDGFVDIFLRYESEQTEKLEMTIVC